MIKKEQIGIKRPEDCGQRRDEFFSLWWLKRNWMNRRDLTGERQNLLSTVRKEKRVLNENRTWTKPIKSLIFVAGFLLLSPFSQSDQWVKRKKNLNYALTSLLPSSKWLAYKLECISQRNSCSSCGCLWYTWRLRRNISGLLDSQVKIPAISTGWMQRHTELEGEMPRLFPLNYDQWLITLIFEFLLPLKPSTPSSHLFASKASLTVFIGIQKVKEWRGSLHESLDLVWEKDL